MRNAVIYQKEIELGEEDRIGWCDSARMDTTTVTFFIPFLLYLPHNERYPRRSRDLIVATKITSCYYGHLFAIPFLSLAHHTFHNVQNPLRQIRFLR